MKQPQQIRNAEPPRQPFTIGGRQIVAGSRTTLELPVARMYTHTPATMPVHVIHGKREGPVLFVSAAVHGDELNGVEVIRRLLKHPTMDRLHGTLLAIPVVNVFGLIQHSRYLPDRRDLNRSFPGSDRGSLAARLAHLFVHEIMERATHGVDIHTGAGHRCNLPQIRTNLENPENNRLARAFGVPVLLNSDLRDGSLREAAATRGIPILLYEAGEALRFDEVAIRSGVRGVRNVMRELGMIPQRAKPRLPREPFVAGSSSWTRAPIGGILRNSTPLGAQVSRNEVMGVISDPFGENEKEVRAHTSGIVISRTNIPLVNEGEALFHIARFEDVSEVVEHLEAFQTEYLPTQGSEPEPPIV